MMNVTELPIGVFDSGVGGLTVAAEIIRHMPAENMIYFGDTARVPYGAKSKETVLRFSRQVFNYLIGKGVKAIVVACNTVSSNCFGELEAEFEIPIFGMVGYGAEASVRATINKKVGVIGTKATVGSGAYERAIRAIDPDVRVYARACPLFVPLAEEGRTDGEIADLIAREYLGELVETGIDTLTLGCTHYPLLLDCIKRNAGGATVVNPAENAALGVKGFLEGNGLARRGTGGAARRFYVSDLTDGFGAVSRAALGMEYVALKADIEDF